MIALRDINGKGFKILAGKKIPKDILKKLDVERLKKENIIKEENQSNYKSEKKDKK